METLKAKVVKPARRVVAKKKTGQALAEDTKKILENTIVEVVQSLSGVSLSEDAIDKVFKDLQIDPSVPLSEADKFLLYNVLMEPILPHVKKVDGEYEVDKENQSEEKYVEIVDTVSNELSEIIPSNRVIGLYDVLPSLKNNRINFDIEKDIFRNKPLLGKGLFKCKYCGSDNTEDYEVQTRRADEGAWVKVICRACTKQYIIT